MVHEGLYQHLFTALLGASMLLGCGSSHVVLYLEDEETVDVRQFNQRLNEKPATVVLSDGTVFDAVSAKAVGDSVSWLDQETKELHAAAIRDVSEVSYRSSGRGAAEGLGLGALIGGLTLGVLGFTDGDDPPCQPGSWICWRYEAEEKAAMTGLFGAIVGGLIGLVAGAGQKSTLTYSFRPAPIYTPAQKRTAEQTGLSFEGKSKLTMEEYEAVLRQARTDTTTKN